MQPFNFFVEGDPIPKGSWKSIGEGRLIPDNKKSKGWETLVMVIAKTKWRGGVLQKVAVYLRLDFYLKRKPSQTRAEPCTKPDLDKLTRAVCDALEGVVYKNDSMVCGSITSKAYADNCRPGVHIFIRGEREG